MDLAIKSQKKIKPRNRSEVAKKRVRRPNLKVSIEPPCVQLLIKKQISFITPLGAVKGNVSDKLPEIKTTKPVKDQKYKFKEYVKVINSSKENTKSYHLKFPRRLNELLMNPTQDLTSANNTFENVIYEIAKKRKARNLLVASRIGGNNITMNPYY